MSGRSTVQWCYTRRFVFIVESHYGEILQEQANQKSDITNWTPTASDELPVAFTVLSEQLYRKRSVCVCAHRRTRTRVHYVICVCCDRDCLGCRLCPWSTQEDAYRNECWSGNSQEENEEWCVYFVSSYEKLRLGKYEACMEAQVLLLCLHRAKLSSHHGCWQRSLIKKVEARQEICSMELAQVLLPSLPGAKLL